VGILWRLLAPKSLKKARRTVRRAAHPVRTASWALSPKPVKQIRRAAFKVSHPLEAAEFAAENAVVRSLRGSKRRRAPTARTALPRVPPVRPATPAGSAQEVKAAYLPGSHEIPVAGLQYHELAVRETLAAIAAGTEADALLLPEPSNPHDPNAIAVYMAGGHVGYLPRDVAAVMQPALISMSVSHGGMPAGCPALVSTADGKSRIVLTIDLSELGIDPGSLGYS
jgi:HIRAN domain